MNGALTTFDSPKEPVLSILQNVGSGKFQLPDFQRGWVWDDEHVRSLLASISLSYPIGAVMMLQAGNDDVRFKPRVVEGVVLGGPVQPERFILDGQQRLTSLFMALLSSQPVPTRDARGKAIRRWYYIDMEQALDPDGDREEAVIGLPEDRIIRNFRGEVLEDYSVANYEFSRGYFPLEHVFACAEWRKQYNKYWNYNGDKIEFFDRFETEIIKRFELNRPGFHRDSGYWEAASGSGCCSS